MHALVKTIFDYIESEGLQANVLTFLVPGYNAYVGRGYNVDNVQAILGAYSFEQATEANRPTLFGNHLWFNGASHQLDAMATLTTVRTIIMVCYQDPVYQVFNPLLGSSVTPYSRNTTYMINSSADAAVQAANWRLNGSTVNPLVTAVPVKPGIITIEAGSNIEIDSIGPSFTGGFVALLAFDTALTSTQRDQFETDLGEGLLISPYDTEAYVVDDAAASAQLVVRPAGSPKKTDILFSSRWPRPQVTTTALPGGEEAYYPDLTTGPSYQYEALPAMRAFFATALAWHYTNGNNACIAEAVGEGFSFIQASVNANLPDALGASTYVKGRALDADGDRIKPSHMIWETAYGDPLDEEYRNSVLQHLTDYLEAGATAIQRDDPDGLGGETYSLKKVNPADPTDVSTEAVNYWSYTTEWAKRVEEFARQGVTLQPYDFADAAEVELLAWMKEVAATIVGAQVPFSGNVKFDRRYTSQNWNKMFICSNYNFWLAEYTGGVDDFWTVFRMGWEEFGKITLFTHAAGGDYANAVAFAACVAIGSTLIVPWDVYTGPSTRYFGSPSIFAPITGFQRAQEALIDEYEEAFFYHPKVNDPRRVNELPFIQIHDSSGVPLTDVAVLIRAKVGQTANVVMHVIDESSTPREVRITLEVARIFSGATALTGTIHYPVAYNRTVHDTVRSSGDFSTLTQSAALSVSLSGGRSTFTIPATISSETVLNPWGIVELVSI